MQDANSEEYFSSRHIVVGFLPHPEFTQQSLPDKYIFHPVPAEAKACIMQAKIAGEKENPPRG